MLSKLGDLVTSESVLQWLLIALLFGYFLFKEWPDITGRIRGRVKKDLQAEETDRTLEQRLDGIESDVKSIKEKLDRDYQRINRIEIDVKQYKANQESTSEELELIMEALMGALGGLQELGANGPTKEAKSKIQDYLNRKAHKTGG